MDEGLRNALIAGLAGSVVPVILGAIAFARTVGRLEGRLDGFEARLDRFEQRLVRIEQRLDNLIDRIAGLTERVARLEAHAGWPSPSD